MKCNFLFHNWIVEGYSLGQQVAKRATHFWLQVIKRENDDLKLISNSDATDLQMARLTKLAGR